MCIPFIFSPHPLHAGKRKGAKGGKKRSANTTPCREATGPHRTGPHRQTAESGVKWICLSSLVQVAAVVCCLRMRNQAVRELKNKYPNSHTDMERERERKIERLALGEGHFQDGTSVEFSMETMGEGET